MRAWAVIESGQPLKEIDLPTPEPKGSEVLLEVTYCGVCHSDLHIWDGYYDVGGGQKMSLKDRGVVLPLAMGHEIVGRVVKLGPDASGVKPGDIRIVFPWLGCGKCEKCLSEDDNMCTVAAKSLVCSPMAATAPMSSPPIRGTWSILEASTCCRRDLRLLRHHGLFRDQEGNAAEADSADRAGRGRGSRA